VQDGDMVAVAKSLNDTAKQTRVLTLKGGILQGQPVGTDEVVRLASLPPADVLQGQVLGAVVGPLTAMVGLFTAPLRDLVGVIDARISQLQEQGDSAEPGAPAEVEEQTETREEEQSGAEAEAETSQPEGAEAEASEPEENEGEGSDGN
jgi:hypothetical protein